MGIRNVSDNSSKAGLGTGIENVGFRVNNKARNRFRMNFGSLGGVEVNGDPVDILRITIPQTKLIDEADPLYERKAQTGGRRLLPALFEAFEQPVCPAFDRIAGIFYEQRLRA